MTRLSIEQAQINLPTLVRALKPADEVEIVENEHVVARLVGPDASAAQPSRKLGSLRGTVTYVAPDFDAPLDDFREYME
jgi:antitoxin (DNA-binding transcriptional repressor) of toxin-antitoxin stability system